jgi:hypothetical protein
MTKYTWQDYKTNEDILSELKIKPSCKENTKLPPPLPPKKGMQHVQQIDKIPHLIMKYQACGN